MLRAPTIGLAILALTIATGSAHAQSSGNFSATGTSATCAIGAGGTFSGGVGINLTKFIANISTGSGSGTTLDIRPDLVTGLFTQTKIDTSVSSASADVGIEVCVKVDGSDAGVLPKSCVVYDQRFQQISSQLFSQISTCFSTVTTTACTVDNDCALLGAGFICNNPTGSNLAGVCVSGPNPLCNFDLILSTLSSHSFDFVIAVDNKKPHTVEASWKVIGAGPSGGNSSVLSCVGPGILTVTQTKVFQNSGSLTFPPTN